MRLLRRFEKLEKKRPVRAPAPATPTSVASRFGEAAPAASGFDAEAPPPTGASTDRFLTEAPDDGPRVLDLARGQTFLRCALCRGDNHATATTCCRCEADLDTPEQRAFNEAFWLRRQEEDAEQRAEAERLRARREQADGEAAEARRHLDWMEHQLAIRRVRRVGRQAELVIDLSSHARTLGLAMGRFLRRVVLAARARWRGEGR